MTDYADAEKQIMNCLLSYTRGIDRLDPEAIKAAATSHFFAASSSGSCQTVIAWRSTIEKILLYFS